MILWLYQFLPSDSKPLEVRNQVYFQFGNHLSLFLVPMSVPFFFFFYLVSGLWTLSSVFLACLSLQIAHGSKWIDSKSQESKNLVP